MKNALIVDDLPDSRLLLRLQLVESGWKVEEAADGAAALHHARRMPPDVIVADLAMPVMDGLALLREWKADARLSSVPFVMLTESLRRSDDHRRIAELGADAIWIKRAPAEGLAAQLQAVCASRAGLATEESDEVQRLRRRIENLETEVARRDLAVVELQNRYDAAVMATGQVLYDWDPKSNAVTYAGSLQSVLGYSHAEMQGGLAHWVSLLHPDDRAGFNAEIQRVIAAAATFSLEYRVRRKDGSYIWVQDTGRFFRNHAGDVVRMLGFVGDITERVRANQTLRDSEERFRQVTENLDEVVWLTSATKLEMIYLSPGFEKIWGRTCASVYAEPTSWMEAIHPGDRARVLAALPGQPQGGYDVEYRIVRPDGAIRWIRDRAVPVRDAQGKVYRVAGVASDVTVARQLEKQFQQAQKMQAVGQLAGGIAHDFNNLLTVVQMQGSFLLGMPMLDMAVRDGVQAMLDASDRGANLTRRLLTFSRRQVTQLRPIDLGEVIGSMAKLLRRVLGEDVVLETRFAPRSCWVNADSGMLEQIVMNLGLNARDAMPRGGRLSIDIDATDLTEARVGMLLPVRAGRYVRLTVADTGTGISPDLLPRIFEPFFTTKEVGKGTGLGLATVFAIVEQHGGTLEVRSTPACGTVFTLYFPALPARAARNLAAEVTRPAVRGGRESILLVEDEADVRIATRSMLERLGYSVLEAANAAEAQQIADRPDTHIDLLLTDLIMPGGTTGRELAERLRRRRQGLRLVFMSGYSPEYLSPQVIAELGGSFLPKPFTYEAAAGTVRRALDLAEPVAS